MVEPEIQTRVALMEQQTARHEVEIRSHEKTFQELSIQVHELVVAAKMFRWIIGFAIAAGPIITTVITKFME